MRSLAALAACLACLAGFASAQEPDHTALLKVTRLPRVAINTSVGFSTIRGITLGDEAFDARPEIADLEKSLKGDETDAVRFARLAELYDYVGDRSRAEAERARARDIRRP